MTKWMVALVAMAAVAGWAWADEPGTISSTLVGDGITVTTTVPARKLPQVDAGPEVPVDEFDAAIQAADKAAAARARQLALHQAVRNASPRREAQRNKGRRPPGCGPGIASWNGPDKSIAEQLRWLVAFGKAENQASPLFLGMLEVIAERAEEEGLRASTTMASTPSDKLPIHEDFSTAGCPVGWVTPRPGDWRFPGGYAEQTGSAANTRYALRYAPGREWTDYEVTAKFAVTDDQPPFRPATAIRLYVRLQDAPTGTEWPGYHMNIDPVNRDLIIGVVKDGRSQMLGRTYLSPGIPMPGTWTMRAQGDAISVYHDGQMLLEIHDRTWPTGTVAIESVHMPIRVEQVDIRELGGRNR